ncbi:MAG: GNAT family N-acetyltransferase [Pseudomonadota bacterium]
MTEICEVDTNAAVELATLCIESFAEAYRGVHSDASIKTYCDEHYAVEKVRAQLADPAIAYRVAYRDDRAVGFLMTREGACPIALLGGSLELKQIYVRASEFGAGLGPRLLTESLRQASVLGKKWLWLSVSDLNARAQAFYEKHNFEAVGTGPLFQVGEDQLSSTLMAREVVTAIS